MNRLIDGLNDGLNDGITRLNAAGCNICATSILKNQICIENAHGMQEWIEASLRGINAYLES